MIQTHSRLPPDGVWEIALVNRREVEMAKVINCDCGFVVRGADDDELVANAQSHASEAHGIELSREQALAIAVPES